jgi:hypothetical protein
MGLGFLGFTGCATAELHKNSSKSGYQNYSQRKIKRSHGLVS